MTAAAARRRTWCGLLAAAVGLVGLTLTAGPGPAAAAPAKTGSAVTVSNPDGAFPNLKVTVAQTKNLINQAVDVSWTGASTTQPPSGDFYRDYLQIMQCWGDAKEGPSREQCQFGGRNSDGRGGPFADDRQVSYGSSLVDPLETQYVQPPNTFEAVFVPFTSVTGVTTTGRRSEFFDANTTNELAFGRTRANGTGQEFFEMHTAQEAPGLGCGEPLTETGGSIVGRSCWLVIVPRSNIEVDGTTREGTSGKRLDSSPLSSTNWAQRLVVPLSFAPTGRACPFGEERRIVGQEPVVEAVSRWQPTLCNGGKGTAYSFSQVPDPVARRQAISPDPGLVLTSRPVPVDLVPAERPLVYAPVSLSGLAIGFLVERKPLDGAGEEVLLKAGTRVEDMKLTPRLVAKLLTQSYVNAVPPGDPAVEGNPQTITTDPEFLKLNPEFSLLVYPSLSDVLAPLGLSDAAAQLWAWIDADAEARAFLDGTADENGMTVNSNYRGIDLPVEDFPKSDPHCQEIELQRPLCALERRGYAVDLHEAARAASRGDSLERSEWTTEPPPTYRRAAPQPGGSRAVLAVTDTATAERYGLRTATLRNAAGEFIGPTEKGLLASVAAAKPGAVKSVLEPDPATKVKAAYPLTTLVYAATAPKALDRKAGREYATFLEYAVGPGQKPGVDPGTLPAGYVPLPEELRKQTRALAKQLRNPPSAAPSSTPAEPSGSPRPSGTAPPDRNNNGQDPGNGSGGGSSGSGGSNAVDGSGSGGTSSGGTTSGGTSTGGTSTGGATTGGATTGGTTSGGATSGGTTSGGTTAAGSTPGGTATGGAGVGTGPVGAGPASQPPVPASVADPPAATPVPDPAVADPVAARSNTPGLAVGAVRFVFFTALLLGALAALAGPVLSRSSRAREVTQSPPTA